MMTQEELFRAQERLLTSCFDQARAYSQIVLGIGYVSIFAAWGFTKEFLTKNEVFWSALLGSLSVFVFVLFEVFSMFITSRTILGLSAAVEQPHRFHQILKEKEAKDRKIMGAYARTWAWCWGFCMITGVGSALILLGAFAGHLWGLN